MSVVEIKLEGLLLDFCVNNDVVYRKLPPHPVQEEIKVPVEVLDSFNEMSEQAGLTAKGKALAQKIEQDIKDGLASSTDFTQRPLIFSSISVPVAHTSPCGKRSRKIFSLS